MKTCSPCSVEQPLSEFYADKRRSDGKQSQCKSCKSSRYGEAARERSRKWYVDNPERHKENTHRLRADNREQYLANSRAYSAARLGNRDPHKPWPTDDCTYNAAHLRVKHARGRATEHACTDCESPAREWSYRGGSDKELTEVRSMPRSRDRVVAYSPDPADYEPRCKPCHTRYDRRELVSA